MYIEVVYALLDFYVIGLEIKNLKRNWEIFNIKDMECM